MLKLSAFSFLFVLGVGITSASEDALRGGRDLQDIEQNVQFITINGDAITIDVYEGPKNVVPVGYLNECLFGGGIPAGTTVTCKVESCTISSSTDLGQPYIFIGMGADNSDQNDIQYTNSTACPTAEATFTFNEAATAGVVAVGAALGNFTDATLKCTSPNWPEATACFSGATTVEVQGKGSVHMKDVQINDKVFVGADSNSKPIYQPVYAFGHANTDSPSSFFQIHTTPQSGKPLEISAAHLIYVEGKSHPVRADSLRVGDKLIEETVHSPAKAVEVTKINLVVRDGAYMPLTKDGPINVNGIKASSYVSIIKDAPAVVDVFAAVFSEDQLLHWWLAPYRMVCQGVPSLCENDKNTEGISYWLEFGQTLAKMANGWGVVGRVVGIALVGLFMAFFMGVEAMIDFIGTLPGAVSALALAGFARKMMSTKHGEMLKKID